MQMQYNWYSLPRWFLILPNNSMCLLRLLRLQQCQNSLHLFYSTFLQMLHQRHQLHRCLGSQTPWLFRLQRLDVTNFYNQPQGYRYCTRFVVQPHICDLVRLCQGLCVLRHRHHSSPHYMQQCFVSHIV